MKKGKNKRLLPLALCLCMLLTALPMTGGVLAGELPGSQDGQQAQENQQTQQQAAKTIIAVNALEEEVARQTAPVGTDKEGLTLPAVLTGTVDGKENTSFPVTWDCDSYDGSRPGEYTFRAAPGDDYMLADGTDLPAVTVTVKAADRPLLRGAVNPTLYTIDKADDWADLQDWLDTKAASNAVVKINIADGPVDGKINVPNKNITVEGMTNTTIQNLRLFSTEAVVLTIKNLNLSADNEDGAIDLARSSTLKFEGENTLTVSNGSAPVIHVPEGRKLTLTGVGTDPALNLIASVFGPGIGIKRIRDGYVDSAGDVHITGGQITINAEEGAGIGGASGPNYNAGNGGKVTISGGKVAITVDMGAGIGGGYAPGTSGNGGDVTITDAQVSIYARYGKSIGSGWAGATDGTGGTLTIDSTGANRTLLGMAGNGTNATTDHSIGTCQINDATGVLTGYYSKLTVTGGMADSSDQQKDYWKPGIFKGGATVDLTADTPPQGGRFINWTAAPALTFNDSKAAVTSFTMPETPQAVTANFAPPVLDSKTPTGDESALWPWALLMLAAGAGIAAAIYRHRSKNQYRHR